MKDYSKLISAILLLFLIITIHHYSNLLYNKIITYYPDSEVHVNMSLPTIFPHEPNNQDVIFHKKYSGTYCAEVSKIKEEREESVSGV